MTILMSQLTMMVSNLILNVPRRQHKDSKDERENNVIQVRYLGDVVVTNLSSSDLLPPTVRYPHMETILCHRVTALEYNSDHRRSAQVSIVAAHQWQRCGVNSDVQIKSFAFTCYSFQI